MCTNGCQDPYELPTGPQGPAGADGIQGLTGPAGADGTQGPAGTNGTNGVDGNDGANGADGLQGTSFRQGVGVPSTSIGNLGDSYVDLSSDDLRLYTRGSSFWTDTGIGLKGTNGADGSDGADATFNYIERGFTASDVSAIFETDVIDSYIFSSPVDSTPGNVNQDAARLKVTFSCKSVSLNEGANAVLTLRLYQGSNEVYSTQQTVLNDGRIDMISFSFMIEDYKGYTQELIKVTAQSDSTQVNLEVPYMILTSNSITS